MKQTLPLILILIVGVFLFASDKNNAIYSSELSFAQLEQDTLTVNGEDVESEITKEQDQDTLFTDEKEEEEWEEKYGMTLWDFLSKMSDSYKEEYYNSMQDEKDKEKKSKKKRGYFRGGAGGWDIYMLPLKIDGINNELADISLGDFDNIIFLTGGGGWMYTSRSIRLGGIGFGGSAVSDGLPGKIEKEVTLNLESGGFTVEKAFHPFNKSEIYIGTMVGGGTVTLDISQWSGPVKWDQLWSGYDINSDTTMHNFYDYKTKLKSNFFTLLPTIGIRYNIFRWCAVGANVGYFYSKIDKEGWNIEGKRVSGLPDIDFSNLIYRFNVYFGG